MKQGSNDIFNGDCNDTNEELKRTIRFTENGDMITPSMRNVPYQVFRVQNIKLWNDRKISKLSLIRAQRSRKLRSLIQLPMAGLKIKFSIFFLTQSLTGCHNYF
jgi:hypothetical protein